MVIKIFVVISLCHRIKPGICTGMGSGWEKSGFFSVMRSIYCWISFRKISSTSEFFQIYLISFSYFILKILSHHTHSRKIPHHILIIWSFWLILNSIIWIMYSVIDSWYSLEKIRFDKKCFLVNVFIDKFWYFNKIIILQTTLFK